MPTVLITGANRGLGLEYARQYSKDGWQVIGTAREPDKATDLKSLGAVEILPLDVGNHESITALAQSLKGRAIDLLVSNAGIYGGKRQSLGDMDYDAWAETFVTNTIGPFQLVEALLPNLQAAKNAKIALMTSLMGSVEDAQGKNGAVIYRSSKSALNMTGTLLAADLKDRGITVLLLHPGWVATDMGGAGAPLQPAESIAGLRRVIAEATLENTGAYLDYRGKTLPW
jgi:NAD(P)-dependent dehydrogenase (short-subunit alcohol dehydrogenase family)